MNKRVLVVGDENQAIALFQEVFRLVTQLGKLPLNLLKLANKLSI